MYSWNQKGLTVAARTSSTEQVPTVERVNGTPASWAARTACTSPRLAIRPAIPTGPRINGILAGSPARVVDVSRCETSRSTRCRVRTFWKSATLAASVHSSLAPPSM